MEHAKEVEPPTGFALVRRSAWLGTKISFVVLAPICVLAWIGLIGIFLYTCVSRGVSPVTLLHAMNEVSSPTNGPTHLAKFIGGLVAGLSLVVVGVGFSAVTGALIGAVAAGVGKLRDRRRAE